MKTKKLPDLIVNTINDEFSLELKTVDSADMSQRIHQLIKNEVINAVTDKLEYWREANQINAVIELDIINGIGKLF